MDQLKAHLAVAVKHGFWISCGLVMIVSLVIWYLTTSKLADENEKQTAKIKTAIQTVSSVQAELPELPNDLSHAEMEKRIEEREGEVLESWSQLFDRQQHILTWPVAELKQDFVDEYEGKIPIEKYIEFPIDEATDMETTLRSRYQRYIKNTLPDIAKIAGTEWTAEFERSMSMDSMMGQMGGGPRRSTTDVDITGAEKGPLVKWSSDSQSQVLKDLFPWRGKLPNSLEVYYSQENIWILKQLLQIVADVNGDARQSYQAKIREIKQIGIGKSVRFGQGNVTKPGEGAMGMMGMMGGDMDMMDMEMGMEMEMGADMLGDMGTIEAVDPAENRYVDAAMAPITGEALRTALASNSPTDAAVAVAKRVPVMLSVNMDQRAVPELIAACGSAPLMVEVHQVRILPETAGGAMGGGMGGGYGEDDGMGGYGGMEDMGGMGGMGGYGGMGGMGGMMAAEPVDETPLDMSIEVYGIIYIYNKPDPLKFGLDQVNEGNVEGILSEATGAEAAPVEDELPTPQADDTATPAPADPAAADPAAADPAAPADPDATVPDDSTAPPADPGDGTSEAVPPVAIIGN